MQFDSLKTNNVESFKNVKKKNITFSIIFV